MGSHVRTILLNAGKTLHVHFRQSMNWHEFVMNRELRFMIMVPRDSVKIFNSNNFNSIKVLIAIFLIAIHF